MSTPSDAVPPSHLGQTSVHLTNHRSFSFVLPFFQNNQDNQTTQTSKETQTLSPHQMVSVQACPMRSLTHVPVLPHSRTDAGIYVHHPCTRASLCASPNRVGCKFIMVRRADGTVLRGLGWDCGGPLINHTDVIGRWEPHGHCRAEHWAHALSPLWLTSNRDGVFVAGGVAEMKVRWRGEEKWRRVEGCGFLLNPKACGVLRSHTHTPHRPGYYGYGHYSALC